MNIKHLRAALSIQKVGSITRAAEDIFLSQSAVSQAIKSLESELGHKIFFKTNAGTEVTDGGRHFLLRIERAFSHIKQIDELLSRSNKKFRAPINRLTKGQLKALIEVTERQSYSAAATYLKVSQPSVHKAIKMLEEISATKLFIRRPNGVDATWLARQMAIQASLFFSELNQAKDELAQKSGNLHKGHVKIGALPLSQATIVPDLILEILRRVPCAEITIVDGSYEEQLKYLIRGEVDMIIGALRDPEPSPHIIQTPLFADPLCIVCGIHNPIAACEAFESDKLENLVWVAPLPNTPARDLFEKFFSEIGVNIPSKIVECSSPVTTRHLLLNLNLVALLPKKQVALDVQTELLSIKALHGNVPQRQISLAVRKSWSPTPLQSTVLELIQAIASDKYSSE